MTAEQQSFLEKLENGLAAMVHDGREEHKEWAKNLAPVIEFLYNDEFEIAVLEAEDRGFDERILQEMRKIYDVRY